MQDPTVVDQRFPDRCVGSSTEPRFEHESRAAAPDITGANLTGHASTLLNALWLGTGNPRS
jgi:hypothetical protein